MSKKIVLEYKFTFLQKLVILCSIPALILMIMGYIMDLFEVDGVIFFYILIFIYPLLIISAFLKVGFLVKNDKLFKTYFFLGISILKFCVDTSRMSKLSVLRFKKSRKLPWFSIARPDLAKDFNCFEINILNNSHTNRKIIIELKREKNINPTIEFLTENTVLEHEKYNPKTRRKVRRGR